MNESSPADSVSKMLRNVLLLSLPILAILLSYFVLDPFQVLYHHNRYDKPMVVIPNRDYISTQMYLNTYQQRPYRSFILGNSRTVAFRVRDWEPYIQDTLAFHYDASGESLYGVWKKLQFLEQHNSPLTNVLIIWDAALLVKTEDQDAHILRKDPRTTGRSMLGFQLSFVKAYLSNAFFYTFLKQRATGTIAPGMEQELESRRIYYDPLTNDMTLPDLDQEIQQDSLGYYARNQRVKVDRQPALGMAVLGAKQLRELVAIRNILLRHKTNYQIVISPLFDQKQFNPSDLALMQRVFEPGRIHDYSGVNPFTASVGNYYEESHYRPVVGRAILKQIYTSGDETKQ